MTRLRMDHVVAVVEDLDAAIAFFTELGLSLGNRMRVEGDWVDRVNAIEGVQVDIAMMRSPDGGQLELTKFISPAVKKPRPEAPNTLGLRSVMFEVDDVDDMVKRLRKHGGALVGEIAQYEDLYRLCYLRGPAGIIVALAEALRR